MIMVCSKCGRLVSRYLKGECLACRYRAARSRAVGRETKKTMRIKVDVSRLPVPPRPATKGYRGLTAEDRTLKMLYEAAKRQQGQKARHGSRKKEYHPNNRFSEEEDARIREMMEAGATIREIADALGRPYSSVVARRKRLREECDELTRFLMEMAE